MARRVVRAHLRQVGVSAALVVVAVTAVIPAVAQESSTSPGCPAADGARDNPPGRARDDCDEPAPDPQPEPEEPVVPSPPPPPTGLDVAVLGEQSIQRDGQIITVTGPPGSSGVIDLQFGDAADRGVDAALAAACTALAEGADAQPVRLAPHLFVVDPSDFRAGDEITVTTTLAPQIVRQGPDSFDGAPTGDLQVGSAPGDPSFDTAELVGQRLAAIRVNRSLPVDPSSNGIWVRRILAGTYTLGDARTAISAKATHWSPSAFGVCFAGEKADPGALSGLAAFEETELFGPVLLPTCSTGTGAPCVEQRTALTNGGVEIVSRIPAEDPWMR